MVTNNFLTWENFRGSYLRPSQRRVHRIAKSPLIEIFADGETNRVGLWLEIPADATPSPELTALVFLTCQVTLRDGVRVLELASANTHLHRVFYQFANAVAHRLLEENGSAVEIVVTELQCFADLLKANSDLSSEREIGLVGELVFLDKLIRGSGPAAVSAWVGPLRDNHDFRLEGREFEVKTSVATRRIHTINGSEQLVSSPDRRLYLVSLLLSAPGQTGFSIPELTETISRKLECAPAFFQAFQRVLDSAGITSSVLRGTRRRFSLRRPMGIMLIDSSTPVLSAAAIARAVGSSAHRIETVQYELNVEGLVFEDGSTEFENCFGG